MLINNPKTVHKSGDTILDRVKLRGVKSPLLTIGVFGTS